MMVRLAIVIGSALVGSLASPASSASPGTSQTIAAHDGQNDFDWEIGTWTTKVKVRRNPLSGGAPDWVEFNGTSVVRPLLNGRANFVELSVARPAGRIEGGALRLYNPKAGQWSLNYANLSNGLLTAPVFGTFDGNGRGTFYGQDAVEGRTILVRFLITRISPTEARFKQAYSADGGQSWEDNWIAVDTRR